MLMAADYIASEITAGPPSHLSYNFEQCIPTFSEHEILTKRAQLALIIHNIHYTKLNKDTLKHLLLSTKPKNRSNQSKNSTPSSEKPKPISKTISNRILILADSRGRNLSSNLTEIWPSRTTEINCIFKPNATFNEVTRFETRCCVSIKSRTQPIGEQINVFRLLLLKCSVS